MFIFRNEIVLGLKQELSLQLFLHYFISSGTLVSLVYLFYSLATEERKPAEVLIVEGQQYAVVG